MCTLLLLLLFLFLAISIARTGGFVARIAVIAERFFLLTLRSALSSVAAVSSDSALSSTYI